jgi:hypothetical protein
VDRTLVPGLAAKAVEVAVKVAVQEADLHEKGNASFSARKKCAAFALSESIL